MSAGEVMLWAVAVLVVAIVSALLMVIVIAVMKAAIAPRKTDRQIQAAAGAEIGSSRAAFIRGARWATRRKP